MSKFKIATTWYVFVVHHGNKYRRNLWVAGHLFNTLEFHFFGLKGFSGLFNIHVLHMTRSRLNPHLRCAWLTGPEPRSGYARTSFGIDAAAEVTISKCNPRES